MNTIGRQLKILFTVSQVYKLYRQQLNARNNWSKALWSNLNPTTLIEGIDNYLNEFHKLVTTVKEMPVGRILEQKMIDFRASIPIMMQLKEDALRERHWQHLMDFIGLQFEWKSNGHFPLSHLFQMNLNLHKVPSPLLNNLEGIQTLASYIIRLLPDRSG